MASINSFEDLAIWQNAQELGVQVFDLSLKNLPISKDYSFKDQIKRAVLSISNNIAEGFEYNNNNDFVRYLRIAKGSCGEVRNCLIFAIKINYASEECLEPLIIQTKTLGSQIGKLLIYLKKLKATRHPQPATRNS